MMFQARLSNVSNRRFKAHNYPNASLVKRLLAMMYDSLLIMAVWMLVGYVFIAFNDGEAVSGPLFNSTVFLGGVVAQSLVIAGDKFVMSKSY